MEVAIALGTDPVTSRGHGARSRAASARSCSAGFLRGEPVDMAQCTTVDLQVPADAEIVLEGYWSGRDDDSRGRSATTPATTRWRTGPGVSI